MKLPRVRLSIRGLLVLVAACAVLLEEFRDGFPPRYVIRGIPGRIARLRPGMTEAETHQILGLDRSWLRGGTGAKFSMSGSGSGVFHQRFNLGGRVLTSVETNGKLVSQWMTCTIYLYYSQPDAGTGKEIPGTQRLKSASFEVYGRTVAEMPIRP